MASNNTSGVPSTQIDAASQITTTQAGASAGSAVAQRSVRDAMSISNLLNPDPASNGSSATSSASTALAPGLAATMGPAFSAGQAAYQMASPAPSTAPPVFSSAPMSGHTAGDSRQSIRNKEIRLTNDALHMTPRSNSDSTMPRGDGNGTPVSGSKRKRAVQEGEAVETTEAVDGRERDSSKKRAKTTGEGTASEEEDGLGTKERLSTTQEAYHGWSGEPGTTDSASSEEQGPEQRRKRQATQAAGEEEKKGSEQLPLTSSYNDRQTETAFAVKVTHINQDLGELAGSSSKITTSTNTPPSQAPSFQRGGPELDFPTLANLWRNSGGSNEDALEVVRTDLSSSSQEAEEEGRQFEAYMGEMYEKAGAESWLDSI